MIRPDIQIISRYQIASSGTTQLRCVQPAQVMQRAGYSVTVQNLYDATPVAGRFIVLHRISMNNYVKHFITCARAREITLIYDTDDLVFDPEGMTYLSKGTKAASYRDGWKPYAEVMRLCDAVTVSTEFLAKRARLINLNTYVVLNALSDDYLQLASTVDAHRRSASHDSVTLAYLSGSNSHDADFATIEETLIEILHKYPFARLLLVGPLKVPETFVKFGDRIIRQGFVPYSKFPTLFQDIDINLIPLETDQAFCHAKSELKFIEAGACGVVSVASPTDPHKAAIRHGENGLLATDDWVDCLSGLIEDKTLRETLGQQARRDILTHYTQDQRQTTWDNVLSTAAEHTDHVAVGFSTHLKSRAVLQLKSGYRALHKWLIKIRTKWTKRSGKEYGATPSQ